MNQQLIWDIPTRVFHWALAIGIGSAFVIAQFGGEYSGILDYHAVIGVATAFVFVLRIMWGLAGSRHARFTSFVFSPSLLAQYLRGVVMGKPIRYGGHNPATSWAALAMFILLGLVITTGLLISAGNESAEEMHEVFVYALLVVIGIHVAGVVVQSVQTKELLIKAIINGRKRTEPGMAISSSRPVVGALSFVFLCLFTASLFANYDQSAHHTHLPLLGTTISVGEGDQEKSHHNDRRSHREDDDD